MRHLQLFYYLNGAKWSSKHCKLRPGSLLGSPFLSFSLCFVFKVTTIFCGNNSDPKTNTLFPHLPFFIIIFFSMMMKLYILF